MVEDYVVLRKEPHGGFPKDHLLSTITKGKLYGVVGKHMRGVTVINDQGYELHISGNLFKKYFKYQPKLIKSYNPEETPLVLEWDNQKHIIRGFATGELITIERGESNASE